MTPVGTIYTEKLDIPSRGFEEGFPGITDRFEWFGISYIGGLVIPSDGNYKFKLTSDDGSKLYIDGELVIVNDGVHSPHTVTKEVYLSKGDHWIGVDYFQGPRVMIALQLFVETPDGEETAVKPQLDPAELVVPIPTLTPASEETLQLTWDGMIGDKVSSSDTGVNPDGSLDGAFTMDVNIGSGVSKTITSMVLGSCDASGTPSGGQVWDTIHDGWSWILGVEDSSGNLLNSADSTITVPITTSGTFKLYSSDSGWFNPGQHFRLTVKFRDGTMAQKVTRIETLTVTPTPTGTPTISPAPTATTPTPTEHHSIQSYNYPDYFIRHRNYLGEITTIVSTLDKKDATFKLVPGLADSR